MILGSLLGDGSLLVSKRYKKARFELRHSIVQKEYFFWKARELKAISSAKSCRVQPADGWSKNEKLHYHSLSHPNLTDFYNLTHSQGKLVFQAKWLKLLTPLSLLVWWLDDGSLVKNSRQGIFCCEGFDVKDMLVLSAHLKRKWDIQAHVGRRGRYHHLRIYSTEELKKFLRLILPHLSVASMLPKVLLLYRDPVLQKRWISEVRRLTGFSSGIIEKYVSEKRKRWKSFRK